MKSLGIDVGSSSVKVSLLDIATGECVASSTNPSAEMRIDAPRAGWAEQDPCGVRKAGKRNPQSVYGSACRAC